MRGPVQELTFQSIAKAADVLEDKIQRTPVYQSLLISDIVNKAVAREYPADDVPDVDLYLKCENLQVINSKFRGATYFISLLSDNVLRRGVVTYSTGNHGLALVRACRMAAKQKGFRIPVAIVMPTNAPSERVDRAKAEGAKVFRVGNCMADCLELAHSIRDSAGMVLVPPSGHPNIVLGQGTVALEFLEQVQEELFQRGEDDSNDNTASDTLSDDASSVDDRFPLDVLVVPSTGSGLLAGAAVACQNTGVCIMAAQLEETVSAPRRSGRLSEDRIDNIDLRRLSHELRAIATEHNWPVLQNTNFVHDVYSANDEEVTAAQRTFVEESGMDLKPSGAVALANLMSNTDLHRRLAEIATYRGTKRLRVGVVISGGSPTLDDMVEMFDPTPSEQPPRQYQQYIYSDPRFSEPESER